VANAALYWMPYTGGCACGVIRYEISAEPIVAAAPESGCAA
jgi:hypothetical protein